MNAERYAELCRLRHLAVSGSPEMHDIDRQVREAGWPPIYRDPKYIAEIGNKDAQPLQALPVSTPDQMADAYRREIAAIIELSITLNRPRLSIDGQRALRERMQVVSDWAYRRAVIEFQLIERTERETAGAAKVAAVMPTALRLPETESVPL